MKFRCLGTFDVVVDGSPADLGEPQQRLVLALLLVHAGSVVSTDRLIDAVWGERPPKSGRKVVQGYVSGLRRVLGSDIVATTPNGYRLDLGRHEYDAVQFAESVAAAESSDDAGEVRALLTGALDLWRGEPFEDLGDQDALVPEIVRLRELRTTSLLRRIEADIALGASRATLAEVADLARSHPLAERVWELWMIALYRSGRHAEALRVFAEARRALAETVGLEPSASLRRLEQMILDHDPALAGDEVVRFLPSRSATRRNPYKGLRAFDEADADDFFGRDALVRRLREAMDRHGGPRMLVLTGPSGSGKSSVVRAGLIPRLREEGWEVASRMPSAVLTPVDDDGPGARRLVFVDQLEEVFSAGVQEPERGRILDRLTDLAEAPGGPWVLATIRTDHVDRALSYLRFARMLGAGLVLVPPLEDHEIRDAIARPAIRAGAAVQPELVAAAVRDAGNRPSALASLEYAMTDLWERAAGAGLSREAYEAAGGISGALARRAEEVYAGLLPGAASTARSLFLELVSLDETAVPLRRRVPRSALAGLPDLEDVLDTFGRSRLLTFDRDERGEPTVEVAHEALFDRWPRLRSWIDDAAEAISRRRRLAEAAAEWERNDRADGYLLAGPRLEQLADTGDLALSDRERRFVEASTAAHRRHRRNRSVLMWTTTLFLAGLAITALVQRSEARREATAATVARLVGESRLALAEDPERAILLALEAVEAAGRAPGSPLPQAVGALQEAVQTSRLEARLPAGAESVDVDGNGRFVAADVLGPEGLGPGSDVVIIDASTGEEIRRLPGDLPVSGGELRPEGGAGRSAIAFAPTGTLLAVAYRSDADRTPVVVWDAVSGRAVETIEVPGRVAWDPTWTEDGEWLAVASWDGRADWVSVWDVGSGREVVTFQPGFVADISLFDAHTIAVAHGPEERIGFYDLLTGTETAELATPGLAAEFLDVERETGMIAVAARHQALEVWDSTDGRLVWSRPVSSTRVIETEPGGGRIAFAGDDGLVRILELEDGRESVELAGHRSGVWDVAFAGDRLYSAGTDGETRVWDVSRGGPPVLGAIEMATGRPFIVDFSPDGSEVAVSTWDGTMERWAVGESRLLAANLDVLTVAGVHPVVSGDWGAVAFVAADGTAGVRDLASGAPVVSLPPCSNPRALSTDASLVVLDGGWLCGPAETVGGEALHSRVVDVGSGEVILDLGQRLVFRAAFNPGATLEADRYLAVNVDPDVLEVYDVTEATLLAELHVLPTMVRFDPSGRFLAFGTIHGRAMVLDLAVLVRDGDPASATVFDRVVAAGGVPGIAITADGILATSAFDSAFIRLWDVDGGELVAEIPTGLEGASPPQLNFTPDGRALLYPDADRVLRWFPLDGDSLAALARDRLTRSLTDEECRRYLDPATCA